MSEKNSEYFDKVASEVLENFKTLGHEDMSDYIVNTYKKRYEKILDESTGRNVTLDLDRLREDLSHIRGIGGQRLDEIMAVIEKHLNEGNE